MTKWLMQIQLKMIMQEVWDRFVAAKNAYDRYIKQLFIIGNMKFASRIRKNVLYNANLFERTQRRGRYGL